ncbi:MAG: transcriptional repressor [Nitrospinae bacterium]|nr:transcriptional repressor [Nitrospinota bacterium]
MAGTARDVLRNYVKSRGLRNTEQRTAVLDALLKAGRHVTADDLFGSLRGKGGGVGYATVCRNLNLLCESGLAEKVKIGNQKTRYEPRFGSDHHDHLICLKCGRFIEVKDDRLERLQDKLASAQGFKPVSHKLEIYGLCKKCR